MNILNDEEKTNLKSQFATSNSCVGARKEFRVFTEQGVAMLATTLKSKAAT